MNPNKALWEKGDFTRIAESMRPAGVALVETLGITEGMDVLDLGCGDGTTAIPAARAGADVLGVDIAANLVAAGNRRAQAEGITNCRCARVPGRRIRAGLMTAWPPVLAAAGRSHGAPARWCRS